MRPSILSAARVVAVILAAAACTFNVSCGPLARPAADRQLFAIDPGGSAPRGPTLPRDGAATTASSGAPALRVRRLHVVNPYAGTAFVYRSGGGAFRTDYYNGFIAPPAELLTEAFVDRLSRAGGFSAVVDSTSSVPARYVLEGNVMALYGDYANRKAPKAIIRIKVFVLDEQARAPRLTFQNEYEATAPIRPASASSLVDGWSKALNSILEQVETDLPSRLGPGATEQHALRADVR